MEATVSIENRLVKTYRQRSAHYDRLISLSSLLGFREWVYREHAVQALGLRPGGTVVEIGCGTGRNFSLLQQAIGPEGRIIGVDLTDAMIAKAKRRVEAEVWSNVEFVNCDAAEYEFPGEVDGVFSTLAISYSPRCDEIIRNGSRALVPGRRWVVMDMKLPPSPASRLLPLAWPFLRPYTVTKDYLEKSPQAILRAMRRNLENTHMEEWYLGLVYIVSGERAVSNEHFTNEHSVANES